jgi:TatD DNase family protein
MRYFDAHAHIQFPEFVEDREELCRDLEARGIGALVVGVHQESSEQAIALADPTHHRYAAVGLHPNYLLEETFAMETYRALAADPKVVAIGECGLDQYRSDDPVSARERQIPVLREHIALAARVDKPLMIHARPSKGTQDAYHSLIGVLREAKQEFGDTVRGNIHFFVAGVEEAQALIELDFTVSYTAVLCFARDYDEVVRYLPLTSILTETDSPYAAPPPNRGTRNDPRSVERVVEALAGIRGEDEEVVRAQVLENARRQFRL